MSMSLNCPANEQNIPCALVQVTSLEVGLQGEAKSRPLRLTVYICKTSEQIYVIFGTLQHCFVLNTSVNFILKKKNYYQWRHLAICAMGPPMWPWRCGLMARPVSGVEPPSDKTKLSFSLAKSSETTAFKCSCL